MKWGICVRFASIVGSHHYSNKDGFVLHENFSEQSNNFEKCIRVKYYDTMRMFGWRRITILKAVMLNVPSWWDVSSFVTDQSHKEHFPMTESN